MMELSMLAVLITCHNRKEKTLQCLKALYTTDVPEGYTFDVFLVDDGSTDGTGETVAEQFPHVNVIYGDGNLFWNRGMHLAWETAAKNLEYDFFLWLNDDVVLYKDALKTMISDYNEIPSSIICGATCSKDLNIVTYSGSLNKNKKITPNGTLQECSLINGNCVLVSKRVYLDNGNLDYKFPHAIGDFDYSLRARKKNIKSYVAKKFIGICEKRDKLADWCLPHVPFLKRIKSLYSPLGNSHPYYYFIFEKKHFGLIVASFHYLSIHLRMLFPFLWKL